MKTIFSTTIFGMALFANIAGAQPIDAAQSKITASFTQMGVTVDSAFTKFQGDVKYDPKNPQQTQATLTVDVASFDLGDAEYNKEVRKPEWFNTAKFPQATFVTQAVKAIAANKLEASGTLTIKGKAQPVVVPIAVQDAGGKRTFSGVLPIKRLTYEIGEGEWAATDMVADDVKIKFTVVLNQEIK